MRICVALCVSLAMLFAASCSGDRAVTPVGGADSPSAVDPSVLADEIVSAGEWPAMEGWMPPPGTGDIVDMSRDVVGGDVVHYVFTVRVGDGPHDLMNIHRVVRETKPYRPIRTRTAVLLQHGDGVGFAGVFLFKAANALDASFAGYLAMNDVDVWGIDQPWILVPQGTSDFGFMADWGIDNQVENLGIGLAVAAAVRTVTGNGPPKLHLMGYSSGNFTTYAYLNMESQLPPGQRLVAGCIAAEGAFGFDTPEARAFPCYLADMMHAQHDAGTYEAFVPFATMGYLALTDPTGLSPLGTGLDNLTTALLYGSATHLFATVTPFYHYVAGVFGGDGLPYDLQFMEVDRWLDFLMGASPYEPILFQGDYADILCGSVDVPWDDHLGDVTVPVLAVTAAGGFGSYADYTLTLLGSDDISQHYISVHGPGMEAVDFGHIDLFIAEGASGYSWGTMLDWLEAHSARVSDLVSNRKK